jgi:ferredoxin
MHWPLNGEPAALEIRMSCVYHDAALGKVLAESSLPNLAESCSMPKIKFVKEKKEIEVEAGANLRQAAMNAGIELYPGIHKNWFANCHGLGHCASCRVHITKGVENVSQQGIFEKARLIGGPITFFARLGHEQDLRLACKARVNGDIEVETQPDVNWHGERFWS